MPIHPRLPGLALALIAGLIPVGESAAAESDGARAGLERLATHLEYFSPFAVRSGGGLVRPRIFVNDKMRARAEADYEAFLEVISNADLDSLEALTKHESPNVRVLALSGLFTRLEHRRVVRVVARLLDDDARVAPIPRTISQPLFRVGGRQEIPVDEQTVADVADAFFEAYAPFVRYDAKETVAERVAAYRKTHHQPRTYAGWLAIEWDFALGTDERPRRKARVAALRKRIERLPRPERDLVFLWLGAIVEHDKRYGAERFTNEAELLEAARSLSHADRLAILAGEPRTDDPDLRLVTQRWPYIRLQRFLLSHAEALLEPGDVPFLRRQHRRSIAGGSSEEPVPKIMPHWCLAAADLAPKQAPAILREAIPAFDPDYLLWEQAAVVAGLWNHAGWDARQDVVAWFYEPRKAGTGSDPRSRFLDRLETNREAETLRLLRMLILHDGFETLAAETFYSFSRVIEQRTGERLITWEERRDLSHPLGVTHFYYRKSRSLSLGNDLAATRELEATVAEWRDRLRKWASAKPGDE